MLACSYSSVCSGCDWLLKPEAESRELKLADFKTQTGFGHETPIEWIEIANSGLRDRVDLMIDRRSGSPKIGLFDRFRTGIVDLQGCPQLSPALEAWLADFRRHELPVERGSIRLRVSPSGQRGVWLDFANLDVKRLLEEKSALRALLKVSIVEIGQRRKRLIEREDGELKLVDPILEAWFETYVDTAQGERAIPLYCAIGSFTQPGFRANQALVREARRRVARVGARHVAEFGSGIGNFTLPLASVAERVDAYEVDELALEGLERSLSDAATTGLLPRERVQIHSGNFQVERKTPVDFRGTELVFVDPPRSGLMKFLDPLAALPSAERPRSFVYVSCFSESFAQDARRLASLGYAPESAAIVEQFPQSRHYEIIASFHR